MLEPQGQITSCSELLLSQTTAWSSMNEMNKSKLFGCGLLMTICRCTREFSILSGIVFAVFVGWWSVLSNVLMVLF